MKYTDKSFSSRPANDQYRDNWDRTFGRMVTEMSRQRFWSTATRPEPKKRGKR